MRIHRRAHVQRIALLDQGIDDVTLAALSRLFAHEIVEALPVGGREASRLYRCPSRRHFVDRAYVEIAVDCQRQTARDRGRAHDQQMRHGRIRALVAHGRPLLDAETVLFVHHHKAEIGERHPFLDERSCADHDPDATVRQPGQRHIPFFSGNASGQKGDVRTAAVGEGNAFQQLAQAAKMLLGQDLRRRQQRRLKAVGRGDQHGGGGHDGLAAADISLHKAAHWHAPRHILPHLVHHPLLRARQGEGQGGLVGRQQRLVNRHCRGIEMLNLLPPALHAELEVEEVIEVDAPAGRLKPLRRRRGVELPQCVGQGDKIVTAAECFRHRIAQRREPCAEGLLRVPADIAVAQPRRQTVYGQYRAVFDGAGADLLEERIFQCLMAHVHADRPAQAVDFADRQTVLQPRLIPPGCADRAAAIVEFRL